MLAGCKVVGLGSITVVSSAEAVEGCWRGLCEVSSRSFYVGVPRGA